jgi:hypothetical protein
MKKDTCVQGKRPGESLVPRYRLSIASLVAGGGGLPSPSAQGLPLPASLCGTWTRELSSMFGDPERVGIPISATVVPWYRSMGICGRQETLMHPHI